MKTHLPACSESLLFSFFLNYNVSNKNLPFCFFTKSDVPQTGTCDFSDYSGCFPKVFPRLPEQSSFREVFCSTKCHEIRRFCTSGHVFSEEFDHKFRTAILKNKSRWFFLTAQNLKLFG